MHYGLGEPVCMLAHQKRQKPLPTGWNYLQKEPETISKIQETNCKIQQENYQKTIKKGSLIANSVAFMSVWIDRFVGVFS